jgi:hypothetical protein
MFTFMLFQIFGIICVKNRWFLTDPIPTESYALKNRRFFNGEALFHPIRVSYILISYKEKRRPFCFTNSVIFL